MLRSCHAVLRGAMLRPGARQPARMLSSTGSDPDPLGGMSDEQIKLVLSASSELLAGEPGAAEGFAGASRPELLALAHLAMERQAARGADTVAKLQESKAEAHFLSAFGTNTGSVAEVEDAIRKLGVDRNVALLHLGAACHNGAAKAYRELAFDGAHFSSEEEATEWESSAGNADGGLLVRAIGAAQRHQSALRMLGPVLPVASVWEGAGQSEEDAEVGKEEGKGEGEDVATGDECGSSFASRSVLMLEHDAFGVLRPAEERCLPRWPPELDEAFALATQATRLARASSKLLLAQAVPAPSRAEIQALLDREDVAADAGSTGDDGDANSAIVTDAALFANDGLGHRVCSQVDAGGDVDHPIAAMLSTNFALLGNLVNLRVLLASRMGSAMYPQLLAWCVPDGKHRLRDVRLLPPCYLSCSPC